jgi:glycosyltransferase involved in cell wall biosynthesis
MNSIRALQIIPGISIGDHSGGAELYAAQISRLLPKDNYKTAIFVMTSFGSEAEFTWRTKLNGNGITLAGFIEQKDSIGSFFRNVIRALWDFVTLFQPDIINSHTERGDVLNMLVHLFHPIHPLAVRTVHIDKQWVTNPWIGAIFNQVCFPVTLNAETAVSQTICRQLDKRPIARLLNKKGHLIHNGIDQKYFNSDTNNQMYPPLPPGIPDIKPKIGVIGRLTEQKGHIELILAMRKVQKVHPVHLLVIGSGPLEIYLKALVEDNSLEDSVHFLGNRKDVMQILPHLDMVVSASLWEGFPTVILEAMSQGVPVIATDISGSCELIESSKTGILVPPGDPQSLAQGILQLLSDPAWARVMGKNAQSYASRFTIQNTAKSHDALYRSLLNKL